MNKEEQLQQLREEYKTASPNRRTDILKEVKAISIECYQCKKATTDDNPEFPFCSSICHDSWSMTQPQYQRSRKTANLTSRELVEKMHDLKKRIYG